MMTYEWTKIIHSTQTLLTGCKQLSRNAWAREQYFERRYMKLINGDDSIHPKYFTGMVLIWKEYYKQKSQ